MLTYASLLVACLVVAVVAYFLYKVVADSSRSVYRSKAPIALLETEGHHRKDAVANAAVAGNVKAFGQKLGHASPENFARTYPAKPTDSVDWGWPASGAQLRKPPLRRGTGQPGAGRGNSSHCSLYDAKTPQPALRPVRQTGKLHREAKNSPIGRTYKVTRKADHVASDGPELNKPWGW